MLQLYGCRATKLPQRCSHQPGGNLSGRLYDPQLVPMFPGWQYQLLLLQEQRLFLGLLQELWQWEEELFLRFLWGWAFLLLPASQKWNLSGVPATVVALPLASHSSGGREPAALPCVFPLVDSTVKRHLDIQARESEVAGYNASHVTLLVCHWLETTKP